MSQLKDVARFTVSWYETSAIQHYNKIYAIENEKEDIFITVTTISDPPQKTILEDTRTNVGNYVYAIANLVYIVMIKAKVPSEIAGDWYYLLRRDINLEVLKEVAIYFDRHKNEVMAVQFDSLRNRLKQIKPSSFEVFPPFSTVYDTSSQTLEVPIPKENPLTEKARKKVQTLEDMSKT